ncbi:MAG: hypothetical protein ACETVT_05420 [bacterium]
MLIRTDSSGCKMDNKVDVIIIGAGLAGVACADERQINKDF